MFQFIRYLTPFLPFQIRDWLAVEEEMLRKQAVVVGDVGEIMEALDKQMVSELSLFVIRIIYVSSIASWLIFISLIIKSRITGRAKRIFEISLIVFRVFSLPYLRLTLSNALTSRVQGTRSTYVGNATICNIHEGRTVTSPPYVGG